ncbi:MAG: outer membrane beta-barrel protein [Bacteroidales bacterium]|nr:outer membrane beta-barrel protein [Bacteroidales bacterium]MCM1147237.1 outer membrane beta-barrel protein [Bacteroidales bacterium]MCM1207204.1 outer membrane beta-barrel protein [Bacillota bacterium]MCM1509733.1 outer membrane beta-barrel protein [Clostridium sp.]
MKTSIVMAAGMMFSLTASAQDQAAAADSIYKEAELGAVVVKGNAPKTKLKGNSMLTKIEGTALSQSGTLEEMLEKVPGMMKNGDDLEVIGKGTPVYYINGRKIQDTNEFKTIRSEEILDVDVIHNPGAQYDATVTAVVRIRTKKRQGEGFGFDFFADGKYNVKNEYFDPSSTLNLNYRHNSVDVFGKVNFWQWHNDHSQTVNQDSYYRTSTVSQEGETASHSNYYGMGYTLGTNWQITDNHSVGARLDIGNQMYGAGTNELDELVLTDGTVTDHIVSQTAQRERNPYNWKTNAYYSGKAGKLGIDLNIDLLGNKTATEEGIGEKSILDTDLISTEKIEKNSMFATKLVLSHPVWKGTLEAGTEMSFVNRESEYMITKTSIPSTEMKVSDKNIAAFVEYGVYIPKVGAANVGLRYEHVGFDYVDRLDPAQDMTRYTDDFFPSASFSTQLGPVQAAVSYSMKTVRPGYWYLSSAISYLNRFCMQTGDPTLKNAIKQELAMNFRYKWASLSMQYEHHKDAITQWSFIGGMEGTPGEPFDEGVILLKPVNLPDAYKQMTLVLSGMPTFGCWTPNWSAVMIKPWLRQLLADPCEESGQRLVERKKPIFVGMFNNAFRLKHSWQLELNATVQSKGENMNFGLNRASATVNAVVQKCWLKNDALCLRLTAQDIFRTGSKQDITMDCGYYTINNVSRFGRQRVGLSVRYSFNTAKSKYKGTGAGADAVSRMGK